jgi:hypothetical protein
MGKQLSNKTFDKIIDSYWNFINDQKLDYVNLEQPFLRYTKKGKLIIDLNDLNSCNVHNRKYEFLQVLNHLKNQI